MRESEYKPGEMPETEGERWPEKELQRLRALLKKGYVLSGYNIFKDSVWRTVLRKEDSVEEFEFDVPLPVFLSAADDLPSREKQLTSGLERILQASSPAGEPETE